VGMFKTRDHQPDGGETAPKCRAGEKHLRHRTCATRIAKGRRISTGGLASRSRAGKAAEQGGFTDGIEFGSGRTVRFSNISRGVFMVHSGPAVFFSVFFGVVQAGFTVPIARR